MITFQGKNIELKMTYKSIHLLEVAFDQAYIEFIAEQTNFNQSLYIFWAMLQNEPEYYGMTVGDVADLLQDSLEKYEFTLQEYFLKVDDAYTKSIVVKQLFDTPDEPSELPRRGGRGKASAFGRKVLYDLMRRLRNLSQRFLDKHSV